MIDKIVGSTSEKQLPPLSELHESTAIDPARSFGLVANKGRGLMQENVSFDGEIPPVLVKDQDDAPPPPTPTPKKSRRTVRALRFFGVVAAAIIGVAFALFAKPGDAYPRIGAFADSWPWAILVGIIILVAPYALLALIRWIGAQINLAKGQDIISGTIGLLVGSVIAGILTIPLAQVHAFNLNYWLPLLAAILFGYLGVAIGLLKREELTRSFVNFFHRRREAAEREETDPEERSVTSGRRGRNRQEKTVEKPAPPLSVLVDTSAIIDGRIADISQTGFIMGTLVVPRFVLEELQHIADSADTLRRNRGRRGLDILNRLQKETTVPVEITDADFDNIPEVDHKLVKLARQLHSPIITNDFNLNKVAELQGIKVLNINELANAVKPALLPGEEMDVKIIQEGKEPSQGVGYLDDGTMIVVEGGKAYLNLEVEVVVTRVLQTVAGRMIFAQPKQPIVNGRRTS